jgi:hypothetical protein
MPLPKTKHPLFETKVPSTGKPLYYRQMLVRDEKILLIAKASEDETDIYRAVKQVVNNCIMDEHDVDKFTTFDIEYLFLKIRAVSIGNLIELAFNDNGDKKEYKFMIDIEDVKIVYPEDVDKMVEVDEDTIIQLRYPPATLFDDERAVGDSDDSYEFIASKCIDKVFHGDDVYLGDDCSDEELLEYIKDLSSKSYKKVRDFITNMPRLSYVIEYQNTEGTERRIPLTTLTDFFTLR